MQLIDLKKQYRLHEEEIQKAILNVLERGDYILGKEVRSLEEQLADFSGVKHCVTTSSGTDSLLIALLALDIGPGDEVITVPFTWVSTVEVIKRVGARPVLVDIDSETLLMDTKAFRKVINSKTKAVIPVSLFGQMPNFDIINELATDAGIHVIEDGAQSFGATQGNIRSCGISDIGITSFFPSKPLSCYGDGGAFFTNSDALAQKARAIRVHGATEKFTHSLPGINGRLDTIQAAVLIEKLKFFEKEIEKRQEFARWYEKNLQLFCKTPVVLDNNTSVYAQYVIRVEDRERVIKEFENSQIPYGLHYPKCVHEHPAYFYLGNEIGDFPNAEQASKEVISIPMHPYLTEEELQKVVTAIEQAALVLA